MKLEDIQPKARIRGLSSGGIATVVSTEWYGGEAIKVVFETPDGKANTRYHEAQGQKRREHTVNRLKFTNNTGGWRIANDAQRASDAIERRPAGGNEAALNSPTGAERKQNGWIFIHQRDDKLTNHDCAKSQDSTSLTTERDLLLCWTLTK